MAELPERVLPAPGAPVVAFDWIAAEAVVAALNGVIERLASQMEERGQAQVTLGEWRGRYRGEFDEMHVGLVFRGVALLAAMADLAARITGAAGEVNDAQTVENAAAPSDQPLLRQGGPQ